MRHLRHVPTWLTYQYCLFFLLSCLLVDKIVCLYFLLLVFLLLWPNDQLANHLTADWSMDWPTDGQTDKQTDRDSQKDTQTDYWRAINGVFLFQILNFFHSYKSFSIFCQFSYTISHLTVLNNVSLIFIRSKLPWCTVHICPMIYQ